MNAGIVGSPHDFSQTGPYSQSPANIAPSGPCSPCHIPHGGDVYAIWSRNLSSYRSLLDVNGGGLYQINYVHAPTIQCYDCHDNHTGGNIDDSPVNTMFSFNHRPQDIAFGGDGPRGTAGYYENNPPDNTSARGAYRNLNPNDPTQLSKTGGHYFKYADPDGSASTYRKGDKLPCRDCHDPHAYSTNWRVFIRNNLPNAGDVTNLSPLYGSEMMTNQDTGSHDNLSSRRICVSCHTYSNTGTLPVRHDQVSTAYTDTSRLPKPPLTVNEHTNSPAVQNVPCVLCHSHNRISPNCDGCHGFSPNPYAPSRNPTPSFGPYPSGSDPHPRHVGRLDGQLPNTFSVYGFSCGTCHATSAMGSRPIPGTHANSAINVAYDFSTLGISNPPDTTSAGQLTCANVYCHSNGGSDPTMAGAGNYYRTVQWGVTTPVPLKCDKCHGVGTTLGSPEYGMPNYASGAAGSATANTHLAHVVNGGYKCSVCHFNTTDNTMTIKGFPSGGVTFTYHVNGSREVVFDNTNATGSYNVDSVQANNKRCDVSCHGTGKALAQRPQWGGTLPFGCFDCHAGAEQIYKPQMSVGAPNPVDNAEYLYSGHGRSSAQGNYPGSGNLPAGFSNYTIAPVSCFVCHARTAAHTSKSANDPFRLGSASDNTLGGFAGTGGFTGAWADNTDALCVGCHGDTTQRATHDNQAKGATTIDALTHARGITGTKYNWPNSPWKCVDCHDPHGDGKSGAERFMMLRSGINAPADNTDSNAGSDVKSIPKRTDANVRSVTFNSLAGYAAGSYAQPGNGTGGTWGPCEVCHTQTTAFSRTSDNTATHAGRTSRCTTCHPHTLGFAPTCFGCHGSSGNRQYWPAGSPGSYPNRAGAHGNHVDTIGTWLYQETSTTGLLVNDAKGSTSVKQIAICGWCHPNPGGSRTGTGEIDHMDNTWTPGIADVHRDGRAGAAVSYTQFYNGNPAAPGGVNDPLAAFDNASHTCSNTLCHNKAVTPATWNAPPTWGIDNCASTKCHPTGAQATSGAHSIHISPKVGTAGGMAYPCTECHVLPTTLRHGNGQVSMGFVGIEASVGGGNGFYDKDDSGGGVPSAGDNNFRAYDGSYHHPCANIYCHGGDNPEWRGTGTRPAWDNTGYVAMIQCGPCHAMFNSPYDPNGVAKIQFSVGNHEVHYKQYTAVAGVEAVNRGPRIDPPDHGPTAWGCAYCHNAGTNCNNCHASHSGSSTSQPTSTHADGKVDFKPTAGTPVAGVNPPAGVTLAATPACDYCHSTATVVTRTYPAPGTTGVAAAKANWDNGSFRLDCLTCHNGITPGNSKAGGEGIPAPNVQGDGTGYGAEARGHNRPASSGSYPGTGNPAANQTCGACHGTSSLHINHVNDNTFAGNRLMDNVNGVTGITGASGLCSACHTNAGTSPATKKSINTHGNTGFPKRLEDNTFVLECSQCHEPHGMVNVTTGATGVNLWMINPTITVAAGVTVSPVRLFAKSGPNSFNTYDPGAGNERNASLYASNAGDQICAVCHANSSAAGFPMKWNIGARHNAPGFAGNVSGKNCATCHAHNLDGVIGTVDGLMPMACNDCHSYPGLDNAGVMKLMSAGHSKHVGRSFPGGDDTNNKGYDCSLCHFDYDHNPSGLTKGQAWPADYYLNVNIRFDNTWNPGAPTYAGANAGTDNAPGNGGTGACAGLYCHGGNASLNASWGGSATTPTWSGTLSCGACHDTGPADTTPGTTFSTGNHPVHIDNTRVYGPGMASFSPGGGCAEGTGCHPRYDLTPNPMGGLHANNLKNLRSTPADNGYVGAALETTQVCRNCHTTYTSANIPVSGDNQVRTRANWNNVNYWVDCLTCHNGTAAGTQATARMDGSGGVAAAIEGTISSMGHGTVGIGCGWCHADSGHIGANRQAGSNPYRLTGYFFSGSYPPLTTLGGIDYICNYCHEMFVGIFHYWRVSGSGAYGPTAKKPTDTHPTTVLAVGSGKDRWYQLPASSHLPLYGDLMDNSYIPSGGANNYVLCVSCHDPHGVGTSPAARRFSGQNTDPKGTKALRFNYSSGSPTPLCSQCHK